jgi:diacylglycerol kinase
MKHQKLLKSFACAFEGIAATVKSERNFRIHMVAAIVALIIGIYVELSIPEYIMLLLTVASVLCAELINTAIENTVDMVCGSTISPIAKLAKDAAAGAVLLTAINAVVVGILLLGTRMFALLMSKL